MSAARSCSFQQLFTVDSEEVKKQKSLFILFMEHFCPIKVINQPFLYDFVLWSSRYDEPLLAIAGE